jgi:ABC-2 type transport system ATP-binding protein
VTSAALLPAVERFEAGEAETARGLEAIARVLSVTRSFGDVVALRDVSLSIAPAEIHALVGPNGAGKTTLFRLLTGLVTADRGMVRVCGRDPGRAGRRVHRQLGVVHSGGRSFYLRISGLENLVFFARLHGLRKRAAVARARDLLEAVDLSAAADRAVSTYSTGMQRRLAVARALLAEPRLLLVDEATHDLDPQNATRVRELIRDAARAGAGVLWTTQRLEEIRGFADRVTVLDVGSVVFAGTVPALLRHADRDQYLLSVASVTALPTELRRNGKLVGFASRTGGGAEHYLLTLADGAILGDALAAVADHGGRLLGCSEARPSVEEAFLSLVGKSQS